MSNEDTLISKLIEETISESTEADSPNSCSDLRKYYEKRLNQVDFISIHDYLEQNQLSHQALVLESFTGCFRIQFKQSVLDFPSNWSVFKEITNSEIVYLDQETDQDYLLDIFSELSGSFHNIVLVNENQKIQLVFLPEDQSLDHLKWIESYFDKKNNRYEEKRAA